MTEQEYIHATNLCKVNIAYNVLKDTTLTDEDNTITGKKRLRLLRDLDSWRDKLYSICNNLD